MTTITEEMHLTEIAMLDYRKEQINWVTGHCGTTFMDVQLCFMPCTVGYICAQYLYIWLKKRRITSWHILLMVEFIILVFPLMISLTFTEWRASLTCFFLVLSLVLHGRNKMATTDKVLKLKWKRLEENRKQFLTAYRAYIMLSTCIAILAVDFVIFPRRLAKTESFGISLMDLGVGSFVFSNSLISGKQNILKTQPLRTSFESILPMMLLGFLRWWSVKSLNYQEHVTEYGIHWNFFFTLAFLSMLLNIFRRLGLFKRSALAGLFLLVVYETALQRYGLADYILHHPRTNWISQNKEGICSLLGYLALYLFGIDIGRLLFESRTWEEWKLFLNQIIKWTVYLWLVILIGYYGDWQISRRMVNSMYVLWVMASNLVFICGFMWIDIYIPYSRKSGIILDAINRNQLAIFLLANLLTGLINRSMYTLYANELTAFLVISGYIFMICFAAYILHHFQISLKFF